MDTMVINGVEVKVIQEDVKYLNRSWFEIDRFPSLSFFDNDGVVRTEDWEVVSNDDFALYMNNCDGFMVWIEKEKYHFDGNGIVHDKDGHIYFVYI